MLPCKSPEGCGVSNSRLTPELANIAGFAAVTAATLESRPSSGSTKGLPGTYGSVTSTPLSKYWLEVHDAPTALNLGTVPVSRPPMSMCSVTVDVSWFSSSDQILRVVGKSCIAMLLNCEPHQMLRSNGRGAE